MSLPSRSGLAEKRIRRGEKPHLPGRSPRIFIFGICALLITSSALQLWAQNPQSPPTSQPAAVGEETPTPYKKMTLDELMDIELMHVEVISVSRRVSTVGQSPSAVTVITQDDIRRSGATSIPQALRMAPGLEVAQIDNST